jgi:hypothetical protein
MRGNGVLVAPLGVGSRRDQEEQILEHRAECRVVRDLDHPGHRLPGTHAGVGERRDRPHIVGEQNATPSASRYAVHRDSQE